MKTPIYNFCRDYAIGGSLRMHMPGHKGKRFIHPLSSVFPLDITEIRGADSLFEAEGIISESESNAASLFKTAKTLYSTGGSTLCIQAMLALAVKPSGVVLAARNAHIAFHNACALLDLEPRWIYGEQGGGSVISYNYTAADVESGIISNGGKPDCVYITSPDYYGKMADISAISAVCKKYGVPLLVDNAHGSHLAFLKESRHPIALGADMCCDSAHKTLPVLTGGAYLHIAEKSFTATAKGAMALFASTSPSYLTLCSLDLCNEYMEKQIEADLADVVLAIASLKSALAPAWEFMDGDLLHLTILPNKSGLTGRKLAEILGEEGITVEYADDFAVVMLFSPLDGAVECDRLFSVLSTIKMPKIRIEQALLPVLRPKRSMSPREACFSENEEIPVAEAEGRICGRVKITCPPGIAIVAAGEGIDSAAINILKKYSILRINVVK